MNTMLVAGGVLLSAQANAAPAGYLRPAPDGPPPETAIVLDRKPDSKDYRFATFIEGTHFTVIGAKGSTGVGVLLGPLGAAANVAAIRQKNQERAAPLAALFATDVAQILKAVRKDRARDAAGALAYELVPVIELRFVNDTDFQVSCAVTASLKAKGKKPWRGRYLVELPGLHAAASPDTPALITPQLEPCLAEANRVFTVHVTGGMLPAETPAQVPWRGQTYVFHIVAAEAPGRIIVPDGGGVSEIAPEGPVTQ